MPALRTRDTQSRTLEVTTDTPQPPTLAIISPTPRAFTFPITHNLTDSPFSSPSNSPFEPDHRPFVYSSSCTTPPPLMRTLSPESTFTSASPSPSSHKRRKSSCSSDIERRPKKGDEDYIKRPENAFILFRRKCCEDRQAAQEEAAAEGPTKKQRQADLSKTISQQWKGLTAEERQFWEGLAKEKKKEHEMMYPNYVYRPQRAKDKDGRSKSRKPKGRREYDHEEESESVSFVLPMAPRHHGRSASAPTPPPYQSIQIPSVYQMTPSCPTSPSLLPMISRRVGHPGHGEDVVSNNFDYLPHENFMPTSFGQAGQFEASLQSSEFLRNMFNMSGQPTMAQRSEQTYDHHPMLLTSSNQLVSPSSSCSSGPSSPNTSPYTPTSAMLAHQFSQLSASGDSSHNQHSRGCGSEPQTQAELDLQVEMQLQQEYASYSWETNSLWPTGPEMLMGDDFDLNSIPPIELGVPMPKYSEDMGMGESSHALYGPEFGHGLEGQFEESQNLDGLLGFDQMMAGHGF